MQDTIKTDVVIMGGGIAGLWTLNRLRAAGYQAVLLEANALGSGQTRYAQGIVHGGTKYALTGKLTASSEAVYGMPKVWRDCLQGRGEVDLTSARLLSEAHYLWSTASLTSKITGFFASHVMRARTRELREPERPELFRNPRFHGTIYALDEPVFDVMSVIRALADPLLFAIAAYEAGSLEMQPGALQFTGPDGIVRRVAYRRIILAAGQGNGELLTALGQAQPVMQLRPLKMVMLRGGLQHRVFAHCLGIGVNPRVTITSHEDDEGRIVWYVGGQLAEDGVKRNDDEQIRAAQTELADLVPWVNFSEAEWAVLDIDRAENRRPDGARPDTFYVDQQDGVITTWPTKLALAPLLADELTAKLQQDGIEPSQQPLPDWPAPPYAQYPWCEAARWGSP